MVNEATAGSAETERNDAATKLRTVKLFCCGWLAGSYLAADIGEAYVIVRDFESRGKIPDGKPYGCASARHHTRSGVIALVRTWDEFDAIAGTHRQFEAGEMRVVTVRARDRILAAIDASEQKWQMHTRAVGEFLDALHSIMVDPLAEGEIPVAQMKSLLLCAAIRDRDEIADLRCQLASKPPAPPSPVDEVLGIMEQESRVVRRVAPVDESGRPLERAREWLDGVDYDPACVIRDLLAEVQRLQNAQGAATGLAPSHEMGLRESAGPPSAQPVLGDATAQYAVNGLRQILDAESVASYFKYRAHDAIVSIQRSDAEVQRLKAEAIEQETKDLEQRERRILAERELARLSELLAQREKGDR